MYWGEEKSITLNCGIILLKMKNNAQQEDIFSLLEKSLQKVRVLLIEKEKKDGGYLVVAGKDGKVKKIPAKDL
jgi:hypothetical protein